MATKKPTAPDLKIGGCTFTNEQLVKLQNIGRALKHPLRHKILRIIESAGAKGIAVTPIYKQLKLEQSVCSQMLATLRNAEIVKAVRQGKEMYYSVNIAGAGKIFNFIKTF